MVIVFSISILRSGMRSRLSVMLKVVEHRSSRRYGVVVERCLQGVSQKVRALMEVRWKIIIP